MEEIKNKIVDYLYSNNRTLEKDYEIIVKLYNMILDLEKKLEEKEKEN